MTPEEFKEILRSKTVEEIVDHYLVTQDPGPYVARTDLALLEDRLKDVFQFSNGDAIETIVVGSAKLGFSYLEKIPKNEGDTYKPAYRSYDPDRSDIDVAVVSQLLYNRIWIDLARQGAKQPRFPWHISLAPYMLSGWIRPDKFPTDPPRRCDDWNRVLNEVRRLPQFRYKALRCGIFHSIYFLKLYQQRGVLIAQRVEVEE